MITTVGRQPVGRTEVAVRATQDVSEALTFKAWVLPADVHGMVRLLDQLIEALYADLADMRHALREVVGEVTSV